MASYTDSMKRRSEYRFHCHRGVLHGAHPIEEVVTCRTCTLLDKRAMRTHQHW